MTDGEVTRGEFDMLKQMVNEQGIRLTSIDEHGTRGVGVIQVQLTELIKDLAELKTEFKSEQRNRITGRRWVLGMAAAGTGAIAALITALVEALPHVHP